MTLIEKRDFILEYLNKLVKVGVSKEYANIVQIIEFNDETVIRIKKEKGEDHGV